MKVDAHFSHDTDEWATPQDFFNKVSYEFGGFDLDVCATAENTKCARFYDKEANGLDEPWAAKNWCNPPYSQLSKWIVKARRERLLGNLTVMLTPARTDTKVFHESIYKMPDVEVRFIKGRLKFGDAKTSAPFPSMLLVFRPYSRL